jgi:hypothetical protein
LGDGLTVSELVEATTGEPGDVLGERVTEDGPLSGDDVEVQAVDAMSSRTLRDTPNRPTASSSDTARTRATAPCRASDAQ